MRSVLLGFTAATLLITGCASKEEPAAAAVVSTEAAVAEVRTEAAKLAPEQLQAIEVKLASVKAHMAKDEYKKALEGIPAIHNDLAALHEVVVARQTQQAAAANEWEELSKEVPVMIKGIQLRVSAWTGTRLPPDISKDAFEAAKADLVTMKAQWSEATAAFGAGNATEAADKGRNVKFKGEETMEKLGMSAA